MRLPIIAHQPVRFYWESRAQAVQRTELFSTEWYTREDRHTERERQSERGTLRDRVRGRPRGRKSASVHVHKRRTEKEERGEERKEGIKVTRSARERGSGAAEAHSGLAPTGTAGRSNKQHRSRVILHEGIEGVL